MWIILIFCGITVLEIVNIIFTCKQDRATVETDPSGFAGVHRFDLKELPPAFVDTVYAIYVTLGAAFSRSFLIKP